VARSLASKLAFLEDGRFGTRTEKKNKGVNFDRLNMTMVLMTA